LPLPLRPRRHATDSVAAAQFIWLWHTEHRRRATSPATGSAGWGRGGPGR
jgi:hypothetical protein